MGILGKSSYVAPPTPVLTPAWNQRQVYGAPAGTFVSISDPLTQSEIDWLGANDRSSSYFVETHNNTQTTGNPVVSDQQQLAQLQSNYDAISLHPSNYDSNREQDQPSFGELGVQLAALKTKVAAETPTVPVVDTSISTQTAADVSVPTATTQTTDNTPTVDTSNNPLQNIFSGSNSTILIALAVIAVVVGVFKL